MLAKMGVVYNSIFAQKAGKKIGYQQSLVKFIKKKAMA